MEPLIQNFLKNMESEILTGIPSGYIELDKILCGFEKGSLYTLSGSPSMGKTSLALNIMRNIAIDFKKPVAYFSYEMTEDQIVSKLISIGSGIKNNKSYTKELNRDELKNLHDETLQLTSSPIFIESLDFCTIDSLAEKCEKKISENQIELIIIDDIQRIEIDIKSRKFAANREQEVSHNVRMLKSYAMKWRIPIIIISQLNRGLENRGDNKPQLSDLRDSGSIENDSDSVIFLHRPEYYGISEDWDGNPTRNVANIIIAKHRSHVVDVADIDIQLKFVKEFAKFEDLDKANLQQFDELDGANFTDMPIGDNFEKDSL